MTTTTTVDAFGDGFEVLYFIVNQYFNHDHVRLRKACLLIRGIALYVWATLIGIEDILVFTESLGAHTFISGLFDLVELFKCVTVQSLDHLHSFCYFSVNIS